jgi:hypothetical protein
MPSAIFVRHFRLSTGHDIKPLHHWLLADNSARLTPPPYYASYHQGLQYGSP